MHLSPSVPEDKEEQCHSVVNGGDRQSPSAPYFGSNRSNGQGGRAEFLKPFKYLHMAALINSLLIPRDVTHKIFQHLPVVCLSDPGFSLFPPTSHPILTAYSSISATLFFPVLW